MAKKNFTGPKKYTYEYPSRYGSHSNMVNQDETEKLDNELMVALEDEHGIYITHLDRLDTGISDPNRYINRIKNDEITKK